MKNKNGITLIALVVTIIVLLILATVTISLIIGDNGIIKRAQEAKIAGRLGRIQDRIYTRDAELEVAFRIGEEGEHQRDFINRLILEDLITSDDSYDVVTYRTIYLGRQKDGTYKYTVDVPDGSGIGREIAEIIKTLPDSNQVGNEYLKNMTLTVKTTTSNQTISLPISNTEGLNINWNAVLNPNNFEIPNYTTNPTYTYATAGEYEVQIQGVSEANTSFGIYVFGIPYDGYPEAIFNAVTKEEYAIAWNDFLEDLSPIIEVKTWGENGFTVFNTIGALKGEIAIPSRNSFVNVEQFRCTFLQNMNITGLIPSNLFANCPKVTSFEAIFESCTSLSGSIPGSLFLNCPRTTNFEAAFWDCTNLTGPIPSNLFANCLKAENFSYAFGYTKLSKIPEGLFANNTKVITFMALFSHCYDLTGEIPSNIFANCPLVTDFTDTFNNCTGLTGLAPELWNIVNVENSEKCFLNCTVLSNYSTIPTSWK